MTLQVRRQPGTGQPSSGSSGVLNLEVIAAPGLNNTRFYFYTSRTISCEQQKQEEFDEDKAAWDEDKAEALELYKSRRVNVENVSKRVHNISFGVLRLDIALNSVYGGGVVSSLSHNYGDNGQGGVGTTEITVWERL